MSTLTMATEVTPQEDEPRGVVGRVLSQMANLDTILRSLSMVAVLAWTAHAHWTLALMLGAPVWLAVCLPIAIDAYVLSALHAWEAAPAKRHTDLLWALTLDGVAVGGSHILAHLPLSSVGASAAGGVLGVVLVLTLWRCRALHVTATRAQAARRAPRPVTPPVPTVTHPVPRPVTSTDTSDDTVTRVIVEGVNRGDTSQAIRDTLSSMGVTLSDSGVRNRKRKLREQGVIS